MNDSRVKASNVDFIALHHCASELNDVNTAVTTKLISRASMIGTSFQFGSWNLQCSTIAKTRLEFRTMEGKPSTSLLRVRCSKV